MGLTGNGGDLVLMLRRRWPVMLVIAAAGLAVSVLLARLDPPRFEATAMIQIEMPVLPAPFAGAARGGDAARILQQIEQRLTSRENLMLMIDRHRLFADQPGMSTDRRIATLRDAIRTRSVPAAAPAARGISALTITTRLPDAAQAARVANDFAQGVLDQSVREQATRAQQTIRFLREEEAHLMSEIAGLEALSARGRAAEGAEAADPPADRRLADLRLRHHGVTLQLAEAEMQQRLEGRAQTERFVLIDRAITPQEPVSGGGGWIVALGTILALALAAGVALLLDRINPVLRTRNQMVRELDMLPLATIPEIALPARRTQGLSDRLMGLADDTPSRLVAMVAGLVLFTALFALLV